MVQTILVIIIGAGVGFLHDSNKATKYELNMEDGTITQVILQKNSNYSCPLYCDADHVHNAVMCNNKCDISQQNYHLHNVKKIDEGIATFCSKKILTMSRLPAKEKLPDVVSASK